MNYLIPMVSGNSNQVQPDDGNIANHRDIFFKHPMLPRLYDSLSPDHSKLSYGYKKFTGCI
jgi:hypothetical protein